jgi:hypothetical protein
VQWTFWDWQSGTIKLENSWQVAGHFGVSGFKVNHLIGLVNHDGILLAMPPLS